MVLESEAWSAYAEIQKLSTLDILLAFEDYSRLRERGLRGGREGRKGRRTGQRKLKAQSGEARWAFSCFSLVDFHSSWSSSPGGKVNPVEESTLHSAPREAR